MDKIASINDLTADPQNLGQESSEAQLAKGIVTIEQQEKEAAAQAQAAILGCHYVNLVGFPISPESITLIDESEAKDLNIICFYRDSTTMRLAAINPADERVVNKLQELKEKYYFQSAGLYMISEHSLEVALKIYDTLPKYREARPGVAISETDLLKFKNEINNLEILQSQINIVNISDVMTIIIAAALRLESTDIHIEAAEENIVVRYRVDGILQNAATMDNHRWREVVSRLKVLSKVKINISDKPQDGRFTIFLSEESKISEGRIDVRVSFLPVSNGESVVMRLLMANVESLSIEMLGMPIRTQEILLEEISKPNGLVLTTGPTGSGKTTTLYAILNRLNQPGTKIITLEDPIEYHLKGINQSQVDDGRGYTFAKGLRSILRQDPDIVMVGEVRDLETAEITVQASLTGHLVLTTLHTNDASGVIPRMLDLGVKEFLLTPAINAVMAQRLVRKLCPVCKKVKTLNESETDLLKKILAVISPKANIDIPINLPKIYEAGHDKNCNFCHGLGYKGRVGIYEIFTMSNEIKELTSQNAPAFKVLEKAIEDGMLTMLQDGVLKAMDGLTSLDEVYEVVGQMDYVDSLYNNIISKTIGQGVKVTKEHLDLATQAAANIAQAGNIFESFKTSEIINVIMAAGVLADAGDIHIDPEEKSVRLRFRIDGILHDIANLPKEYYVPLLDEIKTLINVSFNDKQATYEGRFSIYLPDTRMDCRVSIVAGGYGETAVLRILSKQAEALAVEDLGLINPALREVQTAITKTKGIIINTGPTGSGKTTTLYSLLNHLNKPDVKIITVEDPIEYHLSGVMQTQIDEKSGYTFDVALKSLLRQNPNILMIGEVRDEQTAKTAIEAALSGHLVLSTVHANSAAGGIIRFVELGVERSFLASSVECSIGQRLARRICEHCKTELDISAEMLAVVKNKLGLIKTAANLNIPEKLIFYKGQGCDKCSQLGYKGRIGLYEIITISPAIKKIVMEANSIDADLETTALEQGFVPLIVDGIIKALNGETTLEEVFRVAN